MKHAIGIMRSLCAAGAVAVALSACSSPESEWAEWADESAAPRRRAPSFLQPRFGSRFGAADEALIADLQEAGRFAELESFFLAKAAEIDARGGTLAPAFAEDARLDAQKAHREIEAWAKYQRDLARYRAHCGIPEPLPLPPSCK